MMDRTFFSDLTYFGRSQLESSTESKLYALGRQNRDMDDSLYRRIELDRMISLDLDGDDSFLSNSNLSDCSSSGQVSISTFGERRKSSPSTSSMRPTARKFTPKCEWRENEPEVRKPRSDLRFSKWNRTSSQKPRSRKSNRQEEGVRKPLSNADRSLNWRRKVDQSGRYSPERRVAREKIVIQKKVVERPRTVPDQCTFTVNDLGGSRAMALKWARFQNLRGTVNTETQKGQAPIAWLPFSFESLKWRNSSGESVLPSVVRGNPDAIGVWYFPTSHFKDEENQLFEIPFHWIKIVQTGARKIRIEQNGDLSPEARKALHAIANVPAPSLDRMSRKLIKYYNAERVLFSRVGSCDPDRIEEAAQNIPEIATLVENLRKQMAGSLIRTMRRQFMQDVLARNMLTRRNPAVMHMIMYPEMSDEERVKIDDIKVAQLLEVKNLYAAATTPRLPEFARNQNGTVPLLDLKKLAEFLFNSGVLPEQFYVNMAKPHAAAEALRTNLVYRTKDEPRDDVQRVSCACNDAKLGDQHRCASADSLKFLVTVLPERWLSDLSSDFIQWRDVQSFSVKRQKNNRFQRTCKKVKNKCDRN